MLPWFSSSCNLFRARANSSLIRGCFFGSSLPRSILGVQKRFFFKFGEMALPILCFFHFGFMTCQIFGTKSARNDRKSPFQQFLGKRCNFSKKGGTRPPSPREVNSRGSSPAVGRFAPSGLPSLFPRLIEMIQSDPLTHDVWVRFLNPDSMGPERFRGARSIELLRVHQMLKGDLFIPIHWGTFNLAFHDWFDPPERLLDAVADNKIKLAIPKPGQPVVYSDPPELDYWWRGYLPEGIKKK